ncbi:hypothetical protein [Salinisphaera sp. LB1]|uniref:hypothetical protein n=1 Tax=Salinisphaera sp. LB1 TaxID=2183911 RepID=UPI0011AB6AE2|nr:hypothetical protein [Salinisphaera sp. LB1]
MAIDDGMPAQDRFFQNRIVQLLGAAIFLIGVTVVGNVIDSKWIGFNSDARIRERQLNKIANRLDQISRIQRDQATSIADRMPTDVASEKFGRVNDHLKTNDGRIGILRGDINVNRNLIQTYMLDKTSAYQFDALPNQYDAVYPLTDPGKPSPKPACPDDTRYVLNSRANY